MRSVNLNLVAPLRAHLLERELCILEEHRVLDITEADRDTRCISHCMCTDADQIGLEYSCRGA